MLPRRSDRSRSVLDGVRHEEVILAVKGDPEAYGEVVVLAELAHLHLGVAALDNKDERLAGVELQTELLDLGKRRDLHIGDDPLNR